VTLEIPPKPQFVSLCRRALTAICREHDFADDEIADLKLAITEACSNSIKHAYGDREVVDSDRVWVTYTVDNEQLVVEVRDEGPGFDWSGPTEVDLPEGGLGISIIQAVCDTFEVSRPNGGSGAELRMTKLRTAS
jgi:serine/threonine-protein kinase RsbW